MVKGRSKFTANKLELNITHVGSPEIIDPLEKKQLVVINGYQGTYQVMRKSSSSCNRCPFGKAFYEVREVVVEPGENLQVTYIQPGCVGPIIYTIREPNRSRVAA